MNKIIVIMLTTLTFAIGQDCGKIMYFVDSSKPGISITYENESGNTEQITTSRNGWTKSFNACAGDFVYVSAQTKNSNSKIKVQILYNFKVIEKATSYGDYVIATASGLIPKR